MTEIHKYLSKTTESATSSLSLSSVGIYSTDEGGEQNGDPSSTSPDYRQSAPRDRGETASAKETRDCITEEEVFRGKRPAISSSDQRAPRVESDEDHTCTSPRASSVCEGLLVARLVPRERCDYDAHKPSARTDPRPLISALWKWQARGKEDGEGEEGGEEVEHATSGPASVDAADRCVMDDEDRVVMDLYLLRSSCLNERQRWEGDVDDETPQDRRKQRIHTLTSAHDATRNDSSRKENDASRNIFHLRMNRDSAEPASRTLRRLELSTTRKLRTLCLCSCHGGRSDGSDRSPRGSDEKVQRGKEENLAAIHRATSSKLVDRTTWKEADLTGLTTAEILRPSENGNEVWAVALTIPTAIVPWGNCVEDLTAKSNDSVYSSSPYDGVETVCLSMVSNPPTLLDVRTFESFSGELFVGVPLVIETDVIHATRAVVTWFADGEVAHCDSPTYSPKASDVGKRVSILVTPIRPGHNGSGCEEAYIFRNVVEPLPSMPIVELREEWRRSRSVRSYQHNNLRVVTYNILADLYAGREVESYLMYGHCDAQDLRRQRRMPMIVAEILSYEADIICLQEVDAAVHDALLRPVLEANGYQGFYSNKVSSQQEGCSMFWSTSTFEPAKEGEMRSYPLKSLLTLAREDGDGDEMGLSRQSTHYYDAKSNIRDFELERWESLNGINHLFASHDEVRRVYRETVGQIVQIARLSMRRLSGVDSARGKPKSVVVSNTHLFYHPMAEHIRVLQAYAVCHKLEEIRREGQIPDPVFICGERAFQLCVVFEIAHPDFRSRLVLSLFVFLQGISILVH
ncbi:hypothetical protein ACHAWF_011353 [Thalassiosira exigua]